MLLYDAAKGSDSFLWNGHSTLEADSRFVCLDTHSLQNAADNIKLFLTLSESKKSKLFNKPGISLML